MIAYLVAMPRADAPSAPDMQTARVIIADDPIDDAERARLGRGGYVVRECRAIRVRSAAEVHDAVTPMLQRDMFQ